MSLYFVPRTPFLWDGSRTTVLTYVSHRAAPQFIIEQIGDNFFPKEKKKLSAGEGREPARITDYKCHALDLSDTFPLNILRP